MTRTPGTTAGGAPPRASSPPSAALVPRRLVAIIVLGLAGNLVYSLLATDREALAASLRLQPRWLILALVLAVAPLMIGAVRVWRWGRLLAPGFRLGAAWQVVLAAELGAAATPSAIGGAPLKVAALARRGLGASGGTALAALGSLEDAVFMSVAIPTAAAATGLLPRFAAVLRQTSDAVLPGQGSLVLLATVAAGAIATWLALRGRRGARRRVRLRRWWREFGGHASLARRLGRRVFLGNCLLAGLQWSCRLSIVAALLAGLGAPMEPVRAAVLQWLCFTAMALVPTPGAVGGAEAAFVLVFGRELPAGLTPLAVGAWRLVTFYGLNLVALLLLAGSSARPPGRPAPGRPALSRPAGARAGSGSRRRARRRRDTARASAVAAPDATRS